MFHLPKTQPLASARLLTFALAVTCGVATPAVSNGTDLSAGWQKKLGTFRVGIVGGNRTLLNIRRALPFRDALQKALGMPVEIFAARDYAALIEAHVGSRIEYAVYSATAFSMAWSKCKCIEPIALPKAADGSTGFKSILLANRLKVASLSAAEKQTVLIPGKHSFAGYAVPTYQLAEPGSSLEDSGWKLDFKNNMESAVQAFLDERASSLFGWTPALTDENNKSKVGTVRGTLASLGSRAKDVKVLWSSPIIPYGPHAVRKGLPFEAKNLLRKFLFNLDEKNPEAYGAIEPTLTGGFVSTTLRNYRPVVEMIQDRSLEKQGELKSNVKPGE